MTAPLRSGDPITVNVALGNRAYDIVIGRGLIATLFEQDGRAGRDARPRSSPTRRWRGCISTHCADMR